MNEIKIICCDIDGTLVRDDKSLSDENKYWISKAVREKGVKFVIVSGRMLSALNHFYDTIGIRGISSCLNGTFLAQYDGTVLASHTIPYEIAKKIVHIKETHNVEMLCIAENRWFTERHEGYIYSKKIKMYMQDSILADPKELIETTPINKFLFMSPDNDVIDSLRLALLEEVGDPSLITFYQGPNFLEVMVGGLNKGSAVDDLISYFNVDRSEVMALGDDTNDIEMLSKAGMGIAMGNALESVKKVAKDVTDTNENDGVAKAIKKYIFHLGD